MVELKHIDSRDIDGLLSAIRTDGGCIATDYLAAETCDDLITDFSPHLEALDWGMDELGYRDEFYGSKTKRLHGLFSKSARMASVLTHETMLAVTRRMFIDTGLSNDVRLSNTELMVLAQDQGNQMFHSDAGSWRRIQQAEKEELLVSVNIALTEFTATNGATRVVPGSHRWPEEREPQDHEICLAIMPKGSALVYSGNVLHSGGANQEPERRIGLYLGYIQSWLRPIENQLVTNAPEDVLALPEQARTLLDVSDGGFTVYA